MARMLRLLVTVGVLIGSLYLPVSAQIQICPGIDYRPSPLGYQQLTVGAAAVGLTPPEGTEVAVVSIEDDAVRYRLDGTAPTATVGMIIRVDTAVVVCGPHSVARLRMIRVTGDAEANIDYYGRR